MSAAASYRAFVMAMERVERRLRQVTSALERAGIAYAVIGGNAVSAWIARTNPAATRTTKDIDLLINRRDADRVGAVLEPLGFRRADLRRLLMFIDPEEPDPRSGVHFIWAGEKVRPSYPHPTPAVDEGIPDPQGWTVLSLPALVRMKLTSNRDIDRVHVRDMLGVGLIDAPLRASLPPDLRARLEEIERDADEQDPG